MEYEKLVQDEREMEDASRERVLNYAHNKPLLHRILPFGYLTLLVVSICLNGLLLLDHVQTSHIEVSCEPSLQQPAAEESPQGQKSHVEVGEDISPNTGLPRNVIKPFVEPTSFHNPKNWTASHEKWKNLDVDMAIVAIDNSWAQQHDLPASQPFPWDENKSIYTLHGLHQLHCIKQIYLSAKEYQAGEEQSFPWEHLSHCFDAIRRQIMCDADDTLREGYAGQEGVSGFAQHRTCRNWDAYVDWATNHTACFKRPLKPDWSTPSVEYYKHCPEGSGFVVDFDRDH